MLLTCLAVLLSQADADIPPVDPEIERASFTLPEGFTAELWASDPMIAKPVQMNFGPDGRLWVATSRTYPQVEVGQVGRDQVIVLDDTDGDGVADSRTVFADDLLIPTGLVPGDGGCYVANSTELLHLKDTDGDGTADRKTIVLSGFGTEDTHHLIHTFRWDPAQRLNFAQSIYIHSHLETPFGVKRLNAGGFWKLRPQTLQADVFAYGLINPWGLAWTETGQTFATDGAGGEGINYILPGGYYKTAANAPRLISGLNPGSPKHCGLEIVGGETLPDDWNGSMLTCDFRGNRVCRFVVTDQAAIANVDPVDEQATDAATASSLFASREMPELIKSNFIAFRPIDVKQGPDGALYIADWYNPIIQHGEVDFRDPRRDRTHGRIWRVTYDGRTTPRTDYTKLSNDELFEVLSDGSAYARQHARRLLVERGRDDDSVLLAMSAWIRTLDGSAKGYWQTRLESVWVQHGLQRVDLRDLDFLLRCGDANVRAAAYEILGDLQHDELVAASFEQSGIRQSESTVAEAADVALVRLAEGVNDFSPRVRLEAVRTAADYDSAEATRIALQALAHPRDRWIDYAVYLTARQTEDRWLPQAIASQDFFDTIDQALFAYQASSSPEVTPLLTKLIFDEELPAEQRPGILELISQRASPSQLAELLGQLRADEPTFAAEVLRAVRGSRSIARSKPAIAAVVPNLLAMPPVAAIEAASLARSLKIEPQQTSATLKSAFAALRRESDSMPPTAIDALIAAEDSSLLRWAIAESEADGEIAALLAAGARRYPNLVAELATDRLLTSSRLDAVVRSLLQTAAGPAALTRSLDEVSLSSDDARRLLSIVRQSGQPQPELEAIIAERGNLKDAKRTYTPESLATIKRLLATADPHRGQAVYRREALACQKCHAIGGAGGKVGPEMRSLGAASPLDYIVESLLAPNARVKEGYNAILILTDEGQVVTGVPVSRTDDAVVLRDANGTLITIAEDAIEGEKPADSLMPAGLVDRLTDAELADLVAFLAALGREPDFTVQPEPIVRQFQVMTTENKAAYTLRRRRYAAAASDSELFVWTPQYSRVDGRLPLAEIPNIVVKNRAAAGTIGVSFVQVPFKQSTTGPHPFSIDAGADPQVWIDDEPIDLGSPKVIDAGEHVLTIGVLRGPDEPESIAVRYAADAAMMNP